MQYSAHTGREALAKGLRMVKMGALSCGAN
jgi:hypothetical protein